MRKLNLMIISVIFFHINLIFAQTDDNPTKFTGGISQSIVYSGDLKKFGYSPGFNIEYKFLKNYLATFIGVEYYKFRKEIQNKSKLGIPPYYVPNWDNDEHLFTCRTDYNTIDLPLGVKVFFCKNIYLITPYLSLGTLLKFTSIKIEYTDLNLSTQVFYVEKESSNYKINKFFRINSFLISIGSDFKLKNNFLLNFELKCTAYNFSAFYTSTIGLKYNF